VPVENRTLVEALTPDRRAEYLAFADPKTAEAKFERCPS